MEGIAALGRATVNPSSGSRAIVAYGANGDSLYGIRDQCLEMLLKADREHLRCLAVRRGSG